MAKRRYINYLVDVQNYVDSQRIESNCNGILFYNTGTVTVTVQGFPILPGSSWGVDGNWGEFDTTYYTVAFPPNSTGVQSVHVVRKTYSNNPGLVFEDGGAEKAFNL